MKLPFTGRFAGDDVISPPTNATEVAFVVVHDSTTGLPCEVTNSGLAVNDVIIVDPTFTVTLAWTWPAALVAVKMYVVVVCGLTVWQALACRLLPTPLLILMLVAPVTCQQSCELWPGLMVCGLAVNTTICGTLAGITWMVMTAVTMAPLAPVAVKVYVVVVCSGPVETLPLGCSAPRPLMVTAVAFAVVQLNVDDWPAVIESGLPLNMMICGRGTGTACTVTTTVAFTVWLAALVAVRV